MVVFSQTDIAVLVEDLDLRFHNYLVEGPDVDDETLLINYLESTTVADQDAATPTAIKVVRKPASKPDVSILKQLFNLFKQFLSFIWDKAKSLKDWLGTQFSKAYDHAKSALKTMKKYISGSWTYIKDHLSKAKAAGLAFLTGCISAIRHLVKASLIDLGKVGKALYKPVSMGLKNGHTAAALLYVLALGTLTFIGSYYIGKLIITAFKGLVNYLKKLIMDAKKKNKGALKNSASRLSTYKNMASKLKSKYKSDKKKEAERLKNEAKKLRDRANREGRIVWKKIK